MNDQTTTPAGPSDIDGWQTARNRRRRVGPRASAAQGATVAPAGSPAASRSHHRQPATQSQTTSVHTQPTATQGHTNSQPTATHSQPTNQNDQPQATQSQASPKPPRLMSFIMDLSVLQRNALAAAAAGGAWHTSEVSSAITLSGRLRTDVWARTSFHILLKFLYFEVRKATIAHNITHYQPRQEMMGKMTSESLSRRSLTGWRTSAGPQHRLFQHST